MRPSGGPQEWKTNYYCFYYWWYQLVGAGCRCRLLVPSMMCPDAAGKKYPLAPAAATRTTQECG